MAVLRFLTLMMLFFFSLQAFAPKNTETYERYLIVVDVQEYYTKKKFTETETQNVLDSINGIIRKTDPQKIIYVGRVHKLINLSLSYPFIFISHDTLAMQWDQRLCIVNQNIIIREKPNIFSSKELLDFLKQKNVEDIVVVGFTAKEFIYQSLKKGRKMHILSGYCSYRHSAYMENRYLTTR